MLENIKILIHYNNESSGGCQLRKICPGEAGKYNGE
jgi:hypothetical protein